MRTKTQTYVLDKKLKVLYNVRMKQEKQVYIHPAIARGRWSMSTNAHRLVLMAMYKIQSEKDECNYDVTFTSQEVAQAFGLEKGYRGHLRELLINAARECIKATIEIECPTDNGQVVWRESKWFTEVKVQDNTFSMSFNPKLSPLLR